MSVAVLHPSVTRIVRDALSDLAPVGRKVPTTKPSRFITVSRFGGVRATEVSDLPIIGVEAWASDPDAAEDLAQQARFAIHQLAGTVVDGVVVYRVSDVSSPNDLPHVTGHPRFAFSVQLHVRSLA